MSHQFCPTHPYHLTSISKLKAWITPGFFLIRAGHILFPFHYTIHFWVCQILVCVFIFLIRKWYIFGRNLCWNFFLGKNLNMEKICAYHSIPTPKSLRSIPYMGRKAKIFRALLHLEHTFRTYILLTFINYIYTFPFPLVLLPFRAFHPFTHSYIIHL